MKIIDKINAYAAQKKPFFSFEFFPPKTEEGLQNLYSRLDQMVALEPGFIDLTWGAGGSTSAKTLEIAGNAQRFFGVEVMMHLTCTNMTQTHLLEVLQQAKAAGISNILALRGDPPVGEANWRQCPNGLYSAEELVALIRRNFGDYFGLAVAGYPEGHSEEVSPEEGLRYLKRKVDAGSDFIVTQLFYDIEAFLRYRDACTKLGVKCPIIPGIMPIQNYERFRRFVDFTQIRVPVKIEEHLATISQDDAAVRSYGIDLAVEMCSRLHQEGVPGVHFYTLNLESAVSAIVRELNWVDDKTSRRSLPWRPATMPNRQQEDVRPIYWSNRPKSYLARTSDWDDFPNGRWGDRRSPSFGSLNDYYMLRRGMKLEQAREKLLNLWGQPQNAADVTNVFVKFCTGDINRLPWSESALARETSLIASPLTDLNESGFLTINSQPSVNGVDSADPAVGWGGDGGIVYQKAYLEMFCSREHLDRVCGAMEKFPSLSFQAINATGDLRTNLPERSVVAVTWGVFPGKEIIQPTVVDTEVFKIWKDEAFQLWLDEWRALYESGSRAWEVISSIHQNYYLLNIVENNYVSGDIFALFREIIGNAST